MDSLVGPGLLRVRPREEPLRPKADIVPCGVCRLSRFLGSSCTVGFASLRWKYWPEAFGWLGSPLVLWSLATFVLADATYGVCLYLVSRNEARAARASKRQ